MRNNPKIAKKMKVTLELWITDEDVTCETRYLRNRMKYDKELYEWYKEHHICPQCGCNEAAPGRVRCEECLLKNAESAANKRNRNSHAEAAAMRERSRKYNQNRRAERKANGLCIWCGKPQHPSSTCFCLECKIKNQRNNEKRKQGIDRSERPMYGMCYICGKQIQSGKLCEECETRCKSNLPDRMHGGLYQFNKQQNNLIFGR